MYTIATHNGSFHADDAFAVAAIMLACGEDAKVIRTRASDVIEAADVVVDVGLVHDPARDRFDHHQEGGAGRRPNGIPYASIGLVWKKYGPKICANSIDISDKIDLKLIATIDANDMGVPLCQSQFPGTANYGLGDLFISLNPTWREEGDADKIFLEAVAFAKKILLTEIRQALDEAAAAEAVLEAYNHAKDKRIVVLNAAYPFQGTLQKLPEPLFAVYPRGGDKGWGAKAVSAGQEFSQRMRFPAEWGAKSGAELQELSGVPDAIFCHPSLHAAYAGSSAGSVALVQKAIENAKNSSAPVSL